MKGKLMFVLFSLVLIFGVFVASCDNGVLPNYDPEEHLKEMDLAARQSVSAAIPVAWTAATDDDPVYQDFYTGAAMYDSNGNVVGVTPGDGSIDTLGGVNIYLGKVGDVKALIDDNHIAAMDSSDFILTLVP